MLQGYRVVDCTSELGWLAGRLLADLGADVVKIEPPGEDVLASTAWQACNVNKRLLRLDVSMPPGAANRERLLALADVLIEAGSPRDATLLDPVALHERHPHLVHVSVTPFGRSGPHATWLASDLELMAAG